jgi:hypothetical protein
MRSGAVHRNAAERTLTPDFHDTLFSIQKKFRPVILSSGKIRVKG